MKRILAAALWMFSISTVGSMVALFLGASDLVGPLLGAGAGLFVALDPSNAIWRHRVPARA